MSESKSVQQSYTLDTALAADHGPDCIIINVGLDKTGQLLNSLDRLIEQVDHYISDTHASTFSAKKLYVIGDWTLTHFRTQGQEKSAHASIPCLLFFLLRLEAHVYNQNHQLILSKQQISTYDEATEKIKALLKKMGNLEELT
jgi:hypothetical protein